MVTMVQPPLEPSRQGLRELITDRLLGLIRSGDLERGSKLPPERELAVMFGVSRTMVREALSALQLAGFVERRRGVGTVVVGTTTKHLDSYIEASASIAELIEARMATELGIVHLLCDRRDYDFGEAESLLSSMRVAVHEEQAPERYILPSLDFHYALARATERPVVAAITENLVELMRPHLWLLIERYTLALARESLELHEQMLVAIRGGELITALGQVTRHYAQYPTLTAGDLPKPRDVSSAAAPGQEAGRS